MNQTLFNAILSMDAYNRGYNQGISTLGGIGSHIGNVQIINQSDVLANSESVNAGFYAIAYQKETSGAVTVSYRGTDFGGHDFVMRKGGAEQRMVA